ncbi:FHA domain-containing protein [Verrucomicrobiota bacterium sgz303538]
MPQLLLTLPDGSEVTHDLTEDVVTVGRVSDNTIQIDDASVSSHHAELTLRGSDYVLVDSGSTNGTRLNGQQVPPDEEHQLQGDDRIRFGNIEAAYISEVGMEQRPMPIESEQPVAVPAASSSRPADFSNASPFQKKNVKKDPKAMAMMGLAALAILVFLASMAVVFQMKSPL